MAFVTILRMYAGPVANGYKLGASCGNPGVECAVGTMADFGAESCQTDIFLKQRYSCETGASHWARLR